MTPVKPIGQMHKKLLALTDWQVPPFKQILGRHAPIRVWHWLPENPCGQTQENPNGVIEQFPPFIHGFGLQAFGITWSHIVPEKLIVHMLNK